MTTNKPEVLAYLFDDGEVTLERDYKYLGAVRPKGQGEKLIRLSDYEALQAECEQLRNDAELYCRLRSLTYEELGQPGVPCVAVPEAENRGRYVAGADLDAAMQEVGL